MKKIIFLTIFLGLCICFLCCNKETTSIGLNLLNDQLGTDFSDSTLLVAFSEKKDSLITSNVAADILGELHDPVFGQTKASFYTQMTLASSSVSFGTAPIFDSLVLSLRYNGGYYGDTTQSVYVRVYKLTEDMKTATSYYNFSTLSHESINQTSDPNFQTRFSPKTKVSIKMDTTTTSVVPQLRIRLDDGFGQDILSKGGFTKASFRSYLKGFYVEAESTGTNGCVAYFNHSASGMTLYYHIQTTATSQTQYSCEFTTATSAGDTVAHFTHYDHDYTQSTNSQFNQMVLNGDHAVGENVLFVQANAGVRTKINFPKLSQQIPKEAIINKAELVISNGMPDDPYFRAPFQLYFQYIDDQGKLNDLPDLNFGESFMGGVYDAQKNEVRFRLTRYVQGILIGKLPNKGGYLIVRAPANNSSRFVFYGTNPANPADLSKRLRLEVAYTLY